MKFQSIIVLLGFGMLLLAGCMVGPGAEAGPIPTIGPLRNEAGGAGRAELLLMSSTNCAEVGEVVTFTVRVTNEAIYPITLTGTPLLDVIIQPARWLKTTPPPAQRWSASNQYPSDIDSVLAPSEAKTYQWQWTADNVFAQQDRRYNDIRVTASAAALIPHDPIPQGSSVDLFVGVSSMNWGLNGIRCAEMRR